MYAAIAGARWKARAQPVAEATSEVSPALPQPRTGGMLAAIAGIRWKASVQPEQTSEGSARDRDEGSTVDAMQSSPPSVSPHSNPFVTVAAAERFKTVQENALEKIGFQRQDSADSQDSAYAMLSPDMSVLESTRLGRILFSRSFLLLRMVLILLNCIAYGMESNCKLNNLMLRMGAPFHQCNGGAAFWCVLFCYIFFVCELIMRVLAEKADFVKGPHSAWNMMDVIIIAMSFLYFVPGGWYNFTVLRVARVLHMAHLTRNTWIQASSRNMWLMSYILRNSLPTLLAATLSVMLLIFIVGLAISMGIQNTLGEFGPEDEQAVEQVKGLAANYGTLPRTMLALFMAVTGGDDWSNLMVPLSSLGCKMTLAYVCYMALTLFGVLNIVMGIFVDQAMQISQNNRELRMKEQLEAEIELVEELKSVFQGADKDSSGTLTWNEFKQLLTDDRVTIYLSTLELDISEAQVLFRLLDSENTDEVSIDYFVWGCMRFKGAAKSIDMCTLLFEHRQQKRMLTDALMVIEQHLQHVALTLGAAPQPPWSPRRVDGSEVARSMRGAGATESMPTATESRLRAAAAVLEDPPELSLPGFAAS